ncbi:MAG: outer membrane beta-barrel protein [Chryseolinea sp.]
MKVITLGLLFCCQVAIGQQFTVTGHVFDSLDNPMPGATVMLLNPSDSTLVKFNVTNSEGLFEIKNLAPSKYWIKITFIGCKTHTSDILPPASGTLVDVGRIVMKESHTKLDELIVSATIPVIVKQDTIEYNASSFKTIRNANVEELLKKLPGVEVDSDGNIVAQGEEVRRITVDGKDFFGGTDPKLATRNLPADAINKVQVHDRKSDQAIFSGIDDGQREKAINLELKPEKRAGAFGNFAAGYGTDNRYQAKANVNRFSKEKQFSVLAMANNTNQQGFSIDEYMNFTAGAQGMMSGGGGAVRIQVNEDNQAGVPLDFGNRANGIMSTFGGGVNFSNRLSSKTDLTASYFLNHLDHSKAQTTYRENFLQNGKFIYNERSAEDNKNENHRISLMVDHKIDSANSLKLTTNASYNQTSIATTSTSENHTEAGESINGSNGTTIAEGSSANLNTNLLYKHRFGKKGRTFSGNFQLAILKADQEGLLDALYKVEGVENDRTITQRSEQTTETQTYGASFSYIEPLGNRNYIEAHYNLRQNVNSVNRPVYDVQDRIELYNDSLSTKYRSDYVYNRASLNFRMNRKKYTLTVGTGVQQTNLKGDVDGQPSIINRSYRNFVPVLRFNYDFSSARHLRFDFETSVEEPTIQQLQPVLDNRDQLNPYQGNPSLRPAYQQSWRLNFTSFDPGSFVTFFMFADIDFVTNAIINSITNQDFIRTTMPVNVASRTSVNVNTTLSFPITPINSRISLGGSLRGERGLNMLDNFTYGITQQTKRGSVRYNYHYQDLLDLNLGVELSDQDIRYELAQPDQHFVNATYTADGTLTFLRKYQITYGLDYLVYKNKSTGFDQSVPLLNFSFSRSFLKNNSGELKISVTNLLDKAIGINQASSVNYVERTTTNSLGRYFMLTFSFALNKQINPMGIRRGGPMMRIMR